MERDDNLKSSKKNCYMHLDAPPNSDCKHAFVKGLSLENSFNPIVGEYNYLFKTQDEKVFVWTHTKDAYSALIIEVQEEIKEKPFWKNLLTVIWLSLSYEEAFEIVFSGDEAFEYKWLYHFDPKKTKLEDAVIYNTPALEKQFITGGRLIKATLLSQIAPVVELLMRDDKAFASISMLKSSFLLHYFCLICEISKNPHPHHPSHEPEIWEQARIIPSMEAAIVQACKSVEAILGKPPNRENRGSVLRHEERWKSLLGIKPEDLFEKANKSFFDFYYDLFFDLRNPSAHSYGDIQFDLERKKTIEAQCFAALIVDAYIQKNTLDLEDAQAKLDFNQEFLKRVSEDM